MMTTGKNEMDAYLDVATDLITHTCMIYNKYYSMTCTPPLYTNTPTPKHSLPNKVIVLIFSS